MILTTVDRLLGSSTSAKASRARDASAPPATGHGLLRYVPKAMEQMKKSSEEKLNQNIPHHPHPMGPNVPVVFWPTPTKSLEIRGPGLNGRLVLTKIQIGTKLRPGWRA